MVILKVRGLYKMTELNKINEEFKCIPVMEEVQETKEGKLVWSATSESYEPKSTSDVIKLTSLIVVDELYQEGFIK